MIKEDFSNIKNYAFPWANDGFDNPDSIIVGAINIPCAITEYDCQCIFEAFISGSAYWIEKIEMVEKEYDEDIKNVETWSEKFAKGAEFSVTFENPDSNDSEYCTELIFNNKLIRGLERYTNKEQWTWELGDVDADIADAMLQYTIFGEVVFC